eukprot:388815-Rhodomonas_salina.2
MSTESESSKRHVLRAGARGRAFRCVKHENGCSRALSQYLWQEAHRVAAAMRMVPRACAMLSLMHQRGEERLRLIVLASVDVGHGRLGAETITLLTLLTLG